MNLCRLVCIDEQLVTVGSLSQAGNSNAKTLAKDHKFVVKLPVDSTEGRDFECKDKVQEVSAVKFHCTTMSEMTASVHDVLLLPDSFQLEVPLQSVLQWQP